MTTVTTPATLQAWLDRLVLAEPVELRSVAIEGLDHGLALRRVHCTRCDAALNWLSAHAHLARTEFTHRNNHGPDARLHEPGDLVPEPAKIATAKCTRCDRPVVWVVTHSGTRLPVDADPSPAGDVVLSTHPGGGDTPLAFFLHTDSERLQTPADSLYRRHAQTCRGRTR